MVEWRERAAVLSEAAQALIVAASEAGAETDKGGKLSTYAARFDSVAAALEEDLLAVGSAQSHGTPTHRLLSNVARRLLREMAARIEAPPSSERQQSERPSKRSRN